MKQKRSLRHLASTREGGETAAARRPAGAAHIAHLLTRRSTAGELVALGHGAVLCEDFSAVYPEKTAELRAALRGGRLTCGPFYIAAGDCLGDGEILFENLLLGEDTVGEAPRDLPLPISAPAPAQLPQLLCHFGYEGVVLADDAFAASASAAVPPSGAAADQAAPAAEQAASCFAAPVSHWAAPEGSECLLLRPCTDTARNGRPDAADVPGLSCITLPPIATKDEISRHTGPLFFEKTAQGGREERAVADLLLYKIEPLCALLAAAEVYPYPAATLGRLWRGLLKNLGEMDRPALATLTARAARIAAVREEAEALLAGVLAAALPHRPEKGENAAALLFTAEGCEDGALAQLTLDLPAGDFSLRDREGNSLTYGINASHPLADGRVRLDITLCLPALDPLALYPVYAFSEHTGRQNDEKTGPEAYIENRHFICDARDGRLRLTCRKTGHTLLSPFFFEDQGDRGRDAFSPAQEGSLLAFPTDFRVTRRGLVSTLTGTATFEIPASYDFSAGYRSVDTVTVTCDLHLTLAGDSDPLRVSCEVRDTAENHRLRLAVRTELMATDVLLDTPFDTTRAEKAELCPASFLCLERDGMYAALLPDGIREVSRVNDTLYLTVCHRAPHRPPVHGPAVGGFALLRGRGSAPDAATLHLAARRYRVGITAAATDFSPAFRIGEEYPAARLGRLPVRWDNPHVLLTACRRSRDGRATVLHLLNLGDGEARLHPTATGRLSLATLAERGEIPLPENGVALTLAPRQAVALILREKGSV